MTEAFDQRRICSEYGASWDPPLRDTKIGLARNVRQGLFPINGLRHPPVDGTSGWYIWAGETLSSADDFFLPIHVWHMTEWCPQAIPYLGLPPGWRFLLAPGQEDVWFDPEILKV